MIKIEAKNLDNIANKHCDAVLPWVQDRIDRLLANKFPPSKSDAKNWYKHFDYDNDKAVFDWLKDNLKDIIIGDCECLESIRKTVDCPTHILKEDKWLKLFDYDKLGNGFDLKNGEKWTNYSLCEALNVKTCFYCNRNSVLAVRSKKDKVTVPQLDHFIDKGTYPIFALSFYNLVPCCSTCNLKKGNKQFSIDTHLHPYHEGCNNAMQFSYWLKQQPTGTNRSILENIELHLKYKESDTVAAKIKKNIEDLGLEDIYKAAHIDNIQEIIDKKIVFSDKYLEILTKQYSLSKEEAYRLAFANYMKEDEHFKRPLAKMTKDIVTELGFLEGEVKAYYSNQKAI